MRVAVVTPFYKTRPDWLAQCHASVRAQTHPCTHILVSDGSGSHGLADFQGQCIELNHNHADNGNTPRSAGAVAALGQGFDAVAWLDADNWFLPNHVESLVQLHAATGAPVCTSTRDLYSLDGERLGACTEVNGVNFADTSCLFVTRAAAGIALQWVLMPREYSPVCDFWVWGWIRLQGVALAHTGKHTAAFRTSYPHHYKRFGRPVPAGVKPEEYLKRCDRLFNQVKAQYGLLRHRKEMHRLNPKRSAAEVFSEVYRLNRWGGERGEFFSGTGADEPLRSPYVALVRDFVKEHGVTSVVDLGCGDFRVGRELRMPGVRYTGVDVVPELIEHNRAHHADASTSFVCLDIANDELPPGDLCLVRQVFQHLSNAQIQATLQKLKRYRHVLVSEHHPSPRVTSRPNVDKPHGSDTRVFDHSGVYLDQPPFSLGGVRCLLSVDVPDFAMAPGEAIKTFLWQPPAQGN